MSRRPSPAHRWATALTWPAGIVMTSWAYMWRTTVLHRREVAVEDAGEHHPPALPDGTDTDELQPPEEGAGPLFHRRYSVLVRDPRLSAEAVMARLQADPNRGAPTTFARFQRVAGDGGTMQRNDEYVVRMPGPWDGPVRVVELDARSFRLATLDGHLEAGQIEFRARDEPGGLRFEIEAWARSGDRLSNLMFGKLRMAKEVQLHMWTSFLERVVDLTGGRMDGGIDIDTRRVDDPA